MFVVIESFEGVWKTADGYTWALNNVSWCKERSSEQVLDGISFRSPKLAIQLHIFIVTSFPVPNIQLIIQAHLDDQDNVRATNVIVTECKHKASTLLRVVTQ